MNEIIIRAMTLRDYDAVIALWGTTPGIGLNQADSRENIAAYLDRNPNQSQVAENGLGIVGAVLCGHDGRRGYLHHLAVAASCRKQGVGRQLVDAALDTLTAVSIDKCHLFIFQDHQEGIAFWTHNGWTLRSDLYIASRNLPAQ